MDAYDLAVVLGVQEVGDGLDALAAAEDLLLHGLDLLELSAEKEHTRTRGQPSSHATHKNCAHAQKLRTRTQSTKKRLRGHRVRGSEEWGYLGLALGVVVVVGQGLGVGLEDLLEAVEHALLLGAVAVLVDLELGQLTGGEHGAERERQRDEKQPVGHRHTKKN